MWQEFQSVGQKVVSSGLVESNFGNMSVLSGSGETFVITKTGVALDEIDKNGIIEVPLYPEKYKAEAGNMAVKKSATEKSATEKSVAEKSAMEKSPAEKLASSETPIHRMIYQKTNAKAILHAHCPYSVVMSILETEIGNSSLIPIDSEGKLFLGEIPIVTGGIGSVELAKNAADAFCSGVNSHSNLNSNLSGIIICGHGTIAIGNTLKEAYRITTQLEYASKIKYLYASAKNLF
ncbi:class II aldolase/adducin family protein [Methanolapillus ohkumae]|uniref:Methylthioribulose-1-phosphate dehydratase n=1 Tax=Methanolapillus ohkumae TaxID=3028298 RepID=A0AA96ZWI0_9EURY|nr:Methylthioribulose-1-phosphate dehydratase [Methanosarcinaceae archaeon Am2]